MPDLSGANWPDFDKYTYVLLRKDVDPGKLQARFPAFFQRYLSPFMDKTRYHMWLQPLSSIHLHSSDLSYDISHNNGDVSYIWLFSSIAILILVIDVINSINPP